MLEDWGIKGIGWRDHFEEGRADLEFVWERGGDERYAARFSIQMPTDEEIRAASVDGRTNRFSQSKYEKARKGRGRQEHRILLLWIKAALNAIESGIVSAEAIFMPWIVGPDGRTVAETMLPRMPQLLSVRADRLLTR